MSNITYLTGDVTAPDTDGQLPLIIAHIVSDLQGSWHRGTARKIRRRWPETEKAFHDWYLERNRNDFGFGSVQFVTIRRRHVVRNVRVANMVAQRGTVIDRLGKARPICYKTIGVCLAQVGRKARRIGATVHMPYIGMNLGDAEWPKIESLIRGNLADQETPVFIYDCTSRKSSDLLLPESPRRTLSLDWSHRSTMRFQLKN